MRTTLFVRRQDGGAWVGLAGRYLVLAKTLVGSGKGVVGDKGSLGRSQDTWGALVEGKKP